MKKSEYQNTKSSPRVRLDSAKRGEAGETNINDKDTNFKTNSNFEFRISNFRQSGQALITLLFFVVISLTITSAAVIIIITNSLSVGKLTEGEIAYYVAESGVENALLRLLRDPNYVGETLSIDGATTIVTVTGTNPKTVVSVGRNGNFQRSVTAQMEYNSGYYTFLNWKEE